MPKILITGNGFDLNLGLPTHYNDFISILNYIVSNGKIDFDKIYSKSLNFDKIKKNFHSFDFDSEKIKLIIEEVNSNLWFNFFKDELKIETWIDFENKIEYVINIIFSSIKNIQDEVFKKGSVQTLDSYGASLFNKDIEIITVLKKFNIISNNLLGNLVLNKEFLINKYNYYTNVNLEKISKHLLTELNSFKNIFNQYFELFVFPFYENVNKNIDEERYISFDRHYTFNYTPTFEKIYGENNITNFLHGKIDTNENKIVLGINEIPNNNIDNRYFIPFTKYFQKLNNKTDYRFIQEYENNKNDRYAFFFLGHSMDRSDADYIHEVFDFIKKLTTNNNKIYVVCRNSESESKLLLNLLDIVGKDEIINLMRNEILSFLQIDSTKFDSELKKDAPSKQINYSGIVTR